MRRLALIALCIAALLAVPAAVAGAEGISYTKESLSQFEAQLASGQVKEVTINRYIRSLRITLKNGSYVKAEYPAHGEPAVAAHLKAKGVPVSFLSPSVAQSEAKKTPVHHKLRYIAGGILVVIVIVVVAVLMWDRRRKMAAE